MRRPRGTRLLMAQASVLCLAIFLLSCHSAPPGLAPIAVAYIGPGTVSLRPDLTVRDAPMMILKHGDRVEIIDTRRRLVRVRTDEKTEGWVDANLLLTSEQMDEMNRITALASKLPSQGKASVGDELNAHTGPSRQSPGLFLIPENTSVEVLAHRTAPRVSGVSQVAIALRPRAIPKKKANGKNAKQGPWLLPLPTPPSVPQNWQRISKPDQADLRASDAADHTPRTALTPPAPPTVEDWSLVRATDGQVGWVLSRMLYMDIPDEVARYTEGRRITAYMPLGQVEDEGRVRHNWVWTTVSAGGKPYDFDSIRVLVWNPVKHRYETAHMERDVVGYYPLELLNSPVPSAPSPDPAKNTVPTPEQKNAPEQTDDRNHKTSESQPPEVKPGEPKAKLTRQEERRKRRREEIRSNKITPEEALANQRDEKRFSLVLQDSADSRLYTRLYALNGRRVRLISKTPMEQTAGQGAAPVATGKPKYDPLAPPPVTAQSWWQKTRAWAQGWTKRL